MSPQSIPLENGEFWDLAGGQVTRAIHLLWAPGKKLEGEVRKEEGGEDQAPPPPPRAGEAPCLSGCELWLLFSFPSIEASWRITSQTPSSSRQKTSPGVGAADLLDSRSGLRRSLPGAWASRPHQRPHLPKLSPSSLGSAARALYPLASVLGPDQSTAPASG